MPFTGSLTKRVMYKEGFLLEALFGGNYKINLKRLETMQKALFTFLLKVNRIFFRSFLWTFSNMDIFGACHRDNCFYQQCSILFSKRRPFFFLNDPTVTVCCWKGKYIGFFCFLRVHSGLHMEQYCEDDYFSLYLNIFPPF